MRLVLSGLKMSRSPHLPARILKDCIEALPGFGCTFSADALNTLLSQGYVLGTAPTVGMVGRVYIPRTGGGEEPSTAGIQLEG